MKRSLAPLSVLILVVTSCSDSGSATAEAPARAAGGGPGVEPEHPFLIVRGDELSELRARAQVQPWRELARDAIFFARDQVFDPSASDFDAKTRMTELCGALALAHVVDPRPARVRKLVDTLAGWEDFYLAQAPPGEGLLVRWRQAAMVQTILALDVMHDDLEPLDRVRIEGQLDGMIGQWWALRAQDGTTSTPGIVALWALYRGRPGLFREATELYLQRLSGNLTPAGVYDSGAGYAWARQGGDRLAKYALLDVLEHTGAVPGLYADARLRTLQEWMYSGTFTPRRTTLTFGDSDPSRPIEALRGYGPPYRAHRFSAQAGRNAAWVVRDIYPAPLLSTYVLLDESILDPEPPSSRVWTDGAAFWEAEVGEDSLMGALWCPGSAGSHSHPDVNAVHLYAYGENVLRNSGYCGDGLGVDAQFPWEWIHDATAANNTLTIDRAEHAARHGAGIREALVAPGFDYAAAAAGPALANGQHTRSLLMVHGEPERPGYFVLLDEVQDAPPGAVVQIHLHPDSERATVVTPGQHYEWRVRRLGAVDVGLTLFLGTRPLIAQLLPGGLCAFDEQEFVGQYLRGTYASDEQGRRQLVTLIVPHDDTHPSPLLSRIDGGGAFSGAALAYGGGRTDFVLEARAESPVLLGPTAFQGRAIHARFVGGVLQQYFLRRARFLDDGRPLRTGFDSDAQVSLFVRGTQAHVTSAGATVVFHDPALTGQTFTTDAGTVLGAGPGFVVIELAAGSFAFDLATGVSLP